MIRAFHGSIVDAGAHAVVNASNPELGLGSGVSGAIQEACGGLAFQRHVRKAWEEEFDSPLLASDCLSTTSLHSEQFRWVLHVASVNFRTRDPETGGHTGPSRIASCRRAALEEAHPLAREHGPPGQFDLAAPLLGAGHGGLGSVASLEAMLRAVRRFSEERTWSLGSFIVAIPAERDMRLVAMAAERFGLPMSPIP